VTKNHDKKTHAMHFTYTRFNKKSYWCYSLSQLKFQVT